MQPSTRSRTLEILSSFWTLGQLRRAVCTTDSTLGLPLTEKMGGFTAWGLLPATLGLRVLWSG